MTSSSSSASRSPVGIGLDPAVVERAQHDRGSRRSCAARRAPSRPGLRPASSPGGSARCTSSKPGGTTFFDFDISASAVEPLVGQARDADRRLVLARRRQPVSALNRRFAPAPVKPTSPRFSIGAQATDQS